MHFISLEFWFAISMIGFVLAFFLYFRARRAEAYMARLTQEQTDFIAVMGHEIRTPMNAVLAAIDLLRQTQLNVRQKELVLLANSSSITLLEIMDDVLDASKMNASQMQLNNVPTDLILLISSIANEQRLQAEAKGINLKVIIDDYDSIILIDPLRVRQILANILSNAIKFTEVGEVILRVTLLQLPADLLELDISVYDTGIGISADQQGKLFKPYSQANRSTNRRYGGTGLGLSICRQLVELMNGKIELSSRLGFGTEIHIRFPVKLVDAVSANELTEIALEDGVGHRGVQTQLNANVRILVVEDNQINRKVIGEQLYELGFNTVLAVDGFAALELLAHDTDFSLILMDCHMPDMDGYEVTKRIRTLKCFENIKTVPIIAISAATGADHQTRSIECGMSGVLSKPLRMKDLSATISLWLDLDVKPVIEKSSPVEAGTETVALFYQMAIDDIKQLKLVCEVNNQEFIAYYLHRVKGSALTIGAIDFSNMITFLETLLQQQTYNREDWDGYLNSLEGLLHSWYKQTTELL